jgi:hypothetical protein
VKIGEDRRSLHAAPPTSIPVSKTEINHHDDCTHAAASQTRAKHTDAHPVGSTYQRLAALVTLGSDTKGLMVPVLIDTGADKTIISQQLYDALRLADALPPLTVTQVPTGPTQLIGAMGYRKNKPGEVTLPMGGRKQRYE